MAARSGGNGARGVAVFRWIARWVVRHPWYPVAFWVALLVVTVPFLPLLGSVTTNSTESLPANAPSSAADARLAELFPNTTGASSAYVLLYGTNLTDAYAQRVVQNLTHALAVDASLAEIASVESVYTQYAGYLAGQAELAGGVLAPAIGSGLPAEANGTAALLWGPPTLFLGTWEAMIANTSRPPAGWDLPAYNATAANLSGPALSVLDAFYAGFNGTPGCSGLAVPAGVAACADNATRAGVNLGPLGLANPLGNATLAGVGVENYSAGWPTIQRVVATVLAASSGLTAAWLLTVWSAFPSGTVGPGPAAGFANATVAAATLATEPLPVPAGILHQFVNRAQSASLVTVTFAVADGYTNSTGATPVYDDLPKIDDLAGSVVRASDPRDTIAVAMTGPAPLDQLTQEAVDSSIALALPLTVALLLAISMIYFRSPLTPAVTFAGLGIALVLSLGGTVLIGTLIEHIDSTGLTLEEVFVLGVGTDYSIFLAARYREEIVAGRPSEEAVVTSMSWAGQSVATSGTTAILVTAALAASGVALLSEWGLVLSLAILITMALSLTLVPAFLTLLGPRIFWPTTGTRFARHAERVTDANRRRTTYFYRAGLLSERRPAAVVAAILVVSVPLVGLALTVPISYDFYGQLPSGHSATSGLADLNARFGAGFATPSYALVTFAHPLLVGNGTNAAEFVDLANLTAIAQGTGGIAAVGSPVGPDGASLADWLSLGNATPPATRANLVGLLDGFLGSDGRTVLIQLQTNTTGLSQDAVGTIRSIESAWGSYAATHPEISRMDFGGAAPVIRDLAEETDTATEFMILAVTIGLIVVLLAVLRSWIIALLAVATIGLSIGWAWSLTYLVFDRLIGFPLFFYVRTILFMLVLGLGIDYSIFLLTRVREERYHGRSSGAAATEAVARTGGIITAAAAILASAFIALDVAEFTLVRAIGFAVAVAVVLDAMVVRTYLVPATLHLLGDRVWSLSGRKPRAPAPAGDAGAAAGTDASAER